MRTRAVLTLMMPAAPKPWITRKAASEASESASAQPSEATVNSIRPPR